MFFNNKEAPVGAIMAAMLTETQFQQQCGSEWVLADGRTASGTRYNSITSEANIPDLRGIFLRGKNNGRSTTTGDTDGDVALGTYQADEASLSIPTYGTGSDDNKLAAGAGAQTDSYSSANLGGGLDETRPRSVVINWFIKIN